MESMNLFENDSAAPKDNLIHYQGELGDFWYDPREFKLEHFGRECLHYIGTRKEVRLPQGCVSTRFMFFRSELPEGFKLIDFDTSEVVDMSYMFCSCKIHEGFSLGARFNTSNVKKYVFYV